MDAPHDGERAVAAGRHIVMMDLDGALLDSSAQHAMAWQEALAPCGYRLSRKDALLHVAHNGPGVIPPLLSRADLRTYGEAIRAMYWAIYTRRYRTTVRPMPGAVELVHDLKARRLQVALVSTSRTALMMYFLERLGLREWIDVAVASEDLNSGQPDPYRVALARLGASSEEAVIIGAFLSALRAARRLGLPFIAVGPPISPYENWAQAGATQSFPGFAELRASPLDLLPAGAPAAWPGKPANKSGAPPQLGEKWLVVTRDQRVAT